MGTNYKVLSDFEVATAEEAQDLFIDSSVVKVDADVDLDDLPTSVKTAYVLNTGILMARDNEDAWKPQGGAAAVSDSAPANPQVGQLWVQPSLVLPAPVRRQLLNGNSGAVTATGWGSDLPSAPTDTSITLPAAAMCTVTFGGLHRLKTSASATSLGARLVWTGAASGNSYDFMGGYAGTTWLYLPASVEVYTHVNVAFTMVLPAGTTTFKIEAQRGSAAATTSVIAYPYISVSPTAWADEYESGVS